MPSSVNVYLDESGDLGWKFGSPYRQGGSSRYLTISALIVPTEKKHLPIRLINDVYKYHKWPRNKEKKWAGMSVSEKLHLTTKAIDLFKKHSNINCTSITVYKPKVYEHIRYDGNKLYNYMIGLILLGKVKTFDEVIFIPDPRSIKVKSGNSLPDYLQTELWFKRNAKTKINYQPSDSMRNRGVQFADMLSGAVQQHYEDNKSQLFQLLEPHIDDRTLYF